MKGSSPYRKLVEMGIDPEDAITKIHWLDEEEQSEVESLASEDVSVMAVDRSADDESFVKSENHSDIIASPIKKRKKQAKKFGINKRKRVGKFGDGGVESLSCKECGKTFPSLKSKYGHMRCHSSKLQNNIMVNKELVQSSSPANSSPEQMLSWSVTENRCRNLGVADIIAARTLVRMSRDYTGFFIMNDDKDDHEVHNENRCELEADSDGTTDTNIQSPVNGKITNEEDLAVILTTSQDKRYRCHTCNKSFATHQALGGHTASHNKRKSIVEESNGADPTRAEESTSEHKCQTCGLSFPSGQALGGHKRKHWTGLNNSCIVAPSSPTPPSEIAETTIHKRVDFDLNKSLAPDDE